MRTTHIAALMTALLIGSASIAGPATNASAEELTGITWTVSPAVGAADSPSIEFRYDRSNTSFSLDDESTPADVRTALGTPGDTAFAIDREPGLLSCRGTVASAYDGRGSCTFAPDSSFEGDLRARGLAPERRGDLLAMALLDADRALIDGLVRTGVAPQSADDVIAASALEVTPEYVAGLKSAGLELSSIEDAVACRALDIDASYVRAMGEAGYRADAEHIIAMKAVGVTPEYARRINAAAQN